MGLSANELQMALMEPLAVVAPYTPLSRAAGHETPVRGVATRLSFFAVLLSSPRMKSHHEPIIWVPSADARGLHWAPKPLYETHPASPNAQQHTQLLFEFTTDILDKQYRSYNWVDIKMQCLLTVDGALATGVFFLLQKGTVTNLFTLDCLMAAFLCLVASLTICLIHSVPKLDSGIGNQNNLRTIIGITRLTPSDYHSKVAALSNSQLLAMNCWQISGMTRNNKRSFHYLRIGVVFTVVGIVAMTGAFIPLSFKGYQQASVSPPQALAGGASPLPSTTAITNSSIADTHRETGPSLHQTNGAGGTALRITNSASSPGRTN